MAFTTTQLFKIFLKEKDLFNGKAVNCSSFTNNFYYILIS